MKTFFVNRRLAFGSAVETWADVERLQALGITHILNLRFSTHSKKVRQFEHRRIPFHDDKKPRPAWFYRRARKFHKRAMKQAGTKLLVMCHYGRCRSASMVYFLLRASGVGPERAKALVLKARPNAKIIRAYRESGEEYLQRIG